jgi:hypothetical protein
LAFFDEADEPSTRVQSRTRGSRSSSRGGGSGGRGPGGGDATIRQRRLIALGAAIVLFLLLAFVVNACLDSRAENRLKDYNRDVGAVVTQSDRDVSRPFFDLMGQGGQSPVELESAINQLRVTAERQVDTAEGFDVPDELETAQRNLLLALDMRASGLGKIAGQVRTALAEGDEADGAVNQIAAQMQQFLASDVVYDTRVIPFIQETLRDKEIGGQELTDSQFLPDLAWLQPATVGERLGAEGGGGGGSGTAGDEEPAPGLHGHGLVSVAVGDTTLQPGETANRIPAGSDLAFRVTVANQGDNEERNVPVQVRIRGDGQPITKRVRIDQTSPGTNAEVVVPLDQAPPIGTPVTIEVSVGRVPGEEKLDNNRQSYSAIFTR